MWVLGQHDTEAQHGTTARHGPIKANSVVLGLRRRPMCRPGTTRHLTVPCLGPSILARPMTGSGRASPARPIGHVYALDMHVDVWCTRGRCKILESHLTANWGFRAINTLLAGHRITRAMLSFPNTSTTHPSHSKRSERHICIEIVFL
jgi:hypothetical protein